MFSFINAVRNHGSTEEIEKLRLEGETEIVETGGDLVYPPPEALRLAVMYSHLNYARYIIRTFGANVLKITLCCPLLLLAVRLNDEAMLKLLCEESAGICAKLNINYVDAKGCERMENGKTALHTAAELGYVNCTHALLLHGANPNVTDSTHKTPLENAATRNRASLNNLKCCVELLKCETQVKTELCPLLYSLHGRVHVDKLCDVCEYIPSRMSLISTLEHLCKCRIRNCLGIRLPKSVKYLPIPQVFRNNVALTDLATAITVNELQ